VKPWSTVGRILRHPTAGALLWEGGRSLGSRGLFPFRIFPTFVCPQNFKNPIPWGYGEWKMADTSNRQLARDDGRGRLPGKTEIETIGGNAHGNW
jgi:hypothetical protein